jgi:hypothetical protein
MSNYNIVESSESIRPAHCAEQVVVLRAEDVMRERRST